MSLNLLHEKVSAFQLRGQLGRCGAFGELNFGWSYFGDPYDEQGVYQIRHDRNGQKTVRLRSYRSMDPMTPAQLANRLKFSLAMAAWQALTPEQRLAYNQNSRKRGMFGWGYFIREYFKNN